VKLTSIAARRVAAAAVVACAAIGVPAIALASPGGPARPAAAAVPKCGVAALRVWLGIPAEGASGSNYYQLELSNISRHACTLTGFPGVSAVAPGGHQLGRPAARDHFDPTRQVTLAPDATAHAVLRIVDTAFFSRSACHPENAIALRVYPPNDTGSLNVDFSFSACKNHGPTFLYVRAVVRGTGIPGFST